MEFRAYDIAESVQEIELSNERKNNIDCIFKQILGDSNESKRKHLSVKCCLSSEHQSKDYVLFDYSQNENKQFDYSKFATGLFNAEKTSDGQKRKKTIQEGFLFIKSDESNLYLMKLEKIEDVDSETFVIRGALGTDNNYYKLCVFKNDFENIIIVDKNTRLAVYWFEKFLGLSRVRDENQNTSELIELIDERKLYSDMNLTDTEKLNLYKFTEDYLFNNEVFDKTQLVSYLNSKNIISTNSLDEVFTDISSNIDYEFNISKSKLKERYKKVIKISDYTEIKTDNFEKLKRRQGIELKENKIILNVDDSFLKLVKEDLE
ncbi:hypothetical protein [Amedibacillus sp. YH-ame10]